MINTMLMFAGAVLLTIVFFYVSTKVLKKMKIYEKFYKYATENNEHKDYIEFEVDVDQRIILKMVTNGAHLNFYYQDILVSTAKIAFHNDHRVFITRLTKGFDYPYRDNLESWMESYIDEHEKKLKELHLINIQKQKELKRKYKENLR